MVWYHWCERVPFRCTLGESRESWPAAALLCCNDCASVQSLAFFASCAFGDLARPQPLEWNPQRTPFLFQRCVVHHIHTQNEAHEGRTGASNGDKWKTWITLIDPSRRPRGAERAWEGG